MMTVRTLSALLLALFVMVGCGGGGGRGGSNDPGSPNNPNNPVNPSSPNNPNPPAGIDTQAPTAQILFPPTASATEASTITVRGTANDDGTISAVRVNGVLATTSNAFGNWQAVVPLAPGQNTLTVEAVDAASNRNAAAAQAVIARTVQFKQVGGLAVDATGNRAFVYDFKSRALFAVDLITGLRTLVSPDQTNNDPRSTRISAPTGIVIDRARNRALALDSSLSGIVAFDLDTGMRTLLTGTGVPNDVNQFVAPRDIALDEKHGRALVVDSSFVYAVSLADGSRTILSGNLTPDAANQLVNPIGIVVDAPNNRALVADNRAQITGAGPNAVVAVSLTDGSRTVLSDASPPNDTNPFLTADLADIALDRQHNRALIASPFAGVVIGVSLVDGSLSIVANIALANTIEVDPAGNRALIVSVQSFGRGRLVGVNLDNGLVSPFTDPSMPTDAPLGSPTDVSFDAASDRLLVLDAELNQIISIGMGQGAARSVLSQLPEPAVEDAPFTFPLAIALDKTNNRVLMTRRLPQPVAIDLTTGTASVLSNGGVGSLLRGVAVDEANQRAFFSQPEVFDAANLFLAADLSGPFSLSPVPLTNVPPGGFPSPNRLAFDATRGRLLATDSNGVVLAISPDDPTPVLLGAPSSSGFAALTGIAVDSAANQALVADAASRSVFAVSLADGSFTTVLNGSHGPNALVGPEGLALDPASGRIFVADFGAGTVFVIDRVTGERVFF